MDNWVEVVQTELAQRRLAHFLCVFARRCVSVRAWWVGVAVCVCAHVSLPCCTVHVRELSLSLLPRGLVAGTVDEVQVDVVQAELAQRRLARFL